MKNTRAFTDSTRPNQAPSARQCLALLIARTPDEALKEALPTIILTLHQATDQICTHRSRGSNKRQSVAPYRPAANAARHANGKIKRLPKLEKPLQWPKKKFSKEHHRRGISITDFLREQWAHLVKAGYGELRWLRMADPSAAVAVENFERIDPKIKQRKRLPLDIRFLREREVIDLQIAMGGDAVWQDHRLLDAAARRLRLGKIVFNP